MTTKEFIKEKIEYLQVVVKQLHTRKLLEELHICRRLAWANYADSADEKLLLLKEQAMEIIKQELATREHIPNKSEARKIRQGRARNKNQRKTMFKK